MRARRGAPGTARIQPGYKHCGDGHRRDTTTAHSSSCPLDAPNAKSGSIDREENVMQAIAQRTADRIVDRNPDATPDRYARCIAASKRIRWDIDKDVIRGRRFDFTRKFLPDGLSRVHELDLLTMEERRLLSQIQGRTYANMFGLVERFIAAKVTEVSRDHVLGDQTAFEALVRFTDEELKHQALFRRIEHLVAEGMPPGYEYVPTPNGAASVVLAKSTWAVLGLTLLIELFTQQHYRESIAPDADLSELYKDVFFYHWREESQHAILDELEWVREDARLSAQERDAAVGDLIDLVGAVDGILQAQSGADARYFGRICGRELSGDELARVEALLLKAYRWQYIVSGVQDARFSVVLATLVDAEQSARIGAALAPIMRDFTAH